MSVDPFAGTRYRALSKLASGQRGDLYIVEHHELGKRFAAKVLRQELLADPRVVDRMRLEAQSLGRLRHPNIVNIVGFDVTNSGSPFLVMELLKGQSLETALSERGAMPLIEAITLVGQLLSALEAAHGIGIIHRNISPKNLFLHEPASGERVVKLLDFGTVRISSGVSRQAPKPLDFPTEAGACLPDADLVCPEVARGETADTRSDLYQVGLILRLMLTGAAHSASSSRSGPASLPANRRRQLPETALDLLQRATANAPDERFQSAREFRRDLLQIAPSDREPTVRGLSDPADKAQQTTVPSSALRHASQTALPAITRWMLFLTLAVGAALFVVLLGRRLRGMP